MNPGRKKLRFVDNVHKVIKVPVVQVPDVVQAIDDCCTPDVPTEPPAETPAPKTTRTRRKE